VFGYPPFTPCSDGLDRERLDKPAFFLDKHPKRPTAPKDCTVSVATLDQQPHLTLLRACPVQQVSSILSLFLHHIDPLLVCNSTVPNAKCRPTSIFTSSPEDQQMAKKKKTQLKPVARGFATTSQPSKRAIAEAQEAATIAQSETTVASTSETTPDQTSSVTPTGESSAITESKTLDFEEQTWQDMVDRWQNKTDREIARTIQVTYPLQFQRWY
jgi:hypothetical protein